MKLNRWYLFLTHLYNFKDTVIRIVRSNAFNVSLIIILVMFSMFVGFMFKYNEIRCELKWQHYLQVSKEEAKKKYTSDQVKWVMHRYGSDSLEIYETVMNTFDPVYVSVMIGIESEYNRNAVSSANCLGLTQCSSDKFRRGQDWRDVKTNINTGANYLKELLHQFNGNKELALAAYNAGPQAVVNAGYQVPQNTLTGETVPYVARGMKMLNYVQSMR